MRKSCLFIANIYLIPIRSIGGTKTQYFVNGNAGVYFMSNLFFAGLSCSNLLINPNDTSNQERTYFFQVGRSFSIQKGYILEPSITSKQSGQFAWHLDANIKLYLPVVENKQLWGALSFRNNMGFLIKDGA